MEILWSPWRHDYINSTTSDNAPPTCIFCVAKADPAQDENKLVIYRGDENFVMLNRYPYTTGHLMIAPYAHIASLTTASKATTDEMMDLARRCERTLRETYRPQGLNVGMNIGQVAGAGVADHIHLHVLPRWSGDTNFMSTVAETRVMSEDLATTYRKLAGQI
ncbi:MAG TPA: HIT domain-containing protein [Pyrinomonadaceae bacterium]|nr:HIT domain-containing protein [Pyrinomonadaceae bacterium]